MKLSELKKYCDLNYKRALVEILEQDNLDYLNSCVKRDCNLDSSFVFSHSQLGFKHWNELVMEWEYKNKVTPYDLAKELLTKVDDNIRQELIEILYDRNLIEETDDKANILINKVLNEFYNKNLEL
jgi:hypothetical protein